MPDKNTFTVYILGASLDTGNRGVSALAASLVKIIRSIKPKSHISFFIGNESPKPQQLQLAGSTLQVNVLNYRLSPKAKLGEHLFWLFLLACLQRIIPVSRLKRLIINSNQRLQALYHADLIGDIRGGDSFSDIYGLKNLLLGSLPVFIPLLLNKKTMLFPQTYGPYDTRLGKFIARLIINHAAHIFSRDRQSADTIKILLQNHATEKFVTFCPDVAFMLDALAPASPVIQPPLHLKEHTPLIGFNVNGLMYNGGYTRDNMFGLKLDYRLFTRRVTETLLMQTPAHILFVPHTFGPPGNINSDPDACRDVLDSLPDTYKDRVHMVTSEYNQSEIKGIIRQCDFFIGSRMHACIAALSQGIPTIGVAYSKKFSGVFESIDAGRMVVDARTTTLEEAVDTIISSFDKRDMLSTFTREQVAKAQHTIQTTFEDILSSSYAQDPVSL